MGLVGLVCTAGCFRGIIGRDEHLYKRPRVTIAEFQTTEMQLAGPKMRFAPGMRSSLARQLAVRDRVVLIDPDSVPASTESAPGRRLCAARAPDYRIQGVIHEFGHRPYRVPWYRRMVRWASESERAVARLQVIVDDLRTNERVLDQEFVPEAEAWAGSIGSLYTGLEFDSPSFSRTPLGACARDVTAQAVRALEARLIYEPWVPRICRVEPDHVVIDGGLDRLMRQGWFYDVMDRPATGSGGDGQVVGTVQVISTRDDHSLARPVRGEPFRVGMRLKRNTEFGRAE